MMLWLGIYVYLFSVCDILCLRAYSLCMQGCVIFSSLDFRGFGRARGISWAGLGPPSSAFWRRFTPGAAYPFLSLSPGGSGTPFPPWNLSGGAAPSLGLRWGPQPGAPSIFTSAPSWLG